MSRSRLEDILPLSPLQEGMHFHAQFDENELDVYTVQFVFHLTGPVDADRLRAAAQALVQRHANLRASFRRRKNGEAIQIIHRQVTVPFSRLDLSGLDELDRQAELDRLIAADRFRRFDLAKAPLLRFALIDLGGGEHRLLFSNHHMLLDGWSMPLVVGELLELYRTGGDPAGLPAVTPPRRYYDWLEAQDRTAAEHAWREVLAGLTEPTLLVPSDPSREAVAPRQLRVTVPDALARRLRERAQSSGLTLNTLVQGAWAVLLGRLTGRQDVVFGATVAGRPPEVPGIESMVGLFINTLPVRVTMDADEPLSGMLNRLQEQQSGLIGHQHLSLSAVQGLTGLPELFDTLVIFENFPVSTGASEEDQGNALNVSSFQGEDSTHYPLTLMVMPGENLTLRVGYRPDLIDDATARSLTRQLERVLAAVADTPQTPVRAVDILAPADREQVLTRWNDTARRLPATDFLELFDARVTQAPDALAVTDDGVTGLSYGELDARVRGLAFYLAELGAGPERFVAVALPRGVDLVVALLAVLRTGAAYLPLDPEYPAERVAYMVGDACPALALVTGETAGLFGSGGPRVVVLDDPATVGAVAGARPVVLPVSDPAHAAYVIYTSGSTGRPKGVVVPRGAVTNFLCAVGERFAPGPGDRLVAVTTVAFDIAVLELYMPLISGAAVVVAERDVVRDPVALAGLVRASGASVMQA
ncbi:condensation domain-containing protein, partial [Streptomyces sindenensis]|uniref:condensation domain-containing protein n=1 Tax=Streptomyces sindenensis TaxID=67363 RepID=UPI00167A7ABD